MKHYILLILLSLSACTAKKTTAPETSQNTSAISEETEGFVIAFGSCNKQNKEQPLWKDIIADQPHLWIWLGDNIYGDSEDMQVLKDKYAQQNANKDYQLLLEKTPIIGTWDDHDYGVNDGDKTYHKKAEARDLALDFLGVKKDAPVRSREGLYQAFEYEYEGFAIRVLLLDTRYFKDPIKKGTNGYAPDATLDLLGEKQWQWLEEQLAKTEDVLIIGNGTQIIPEEHRFEKWANYPTSRTRFLNLLEKKETKKIVLLSGDRHIGEISRLKLGEKQIFEVTASGLTHSYTSVGEEANQHRVGELTGQLNYGIIGVKKNGTVDLMLSGENQKRHLMVNY